MTGFVYDLSRPWRTEDVFRRLREANPGAPDEVIYELMDLAYGPLDVHTPPKKKQKVMSQMQAEGVNKAIAARKARATTMPEKKGKRRIIVRR